MKKSDLALTLAQKSKNINVSFKILIEDNENY